MLARNKVLSHAILILLLVSAFPLIVHVSSENASATSADNTWISDSASYSGISTNWENGSLEAGQNVWFVDAHDGSCTWNNSNGITSVGAFNIRTGYSGTITQAASFSVTSYSQAAGIYTGSTSYTLTDSGNFLKTGGTITDFTLNLIMSGASKTLTGIYNLYSLQVSGSLTMITADASGSRLIIDNGASFTMTGFNFHIAYSIGASTFSNAGTIIGGTLNYRLYYTEQTISFGGVYTNVAFNFYATSTNANRILTAGTGLNAGGGSITVASQHATYTITLNLNGYPLSATDITIGTRGIITAGASTITCSGNWDSSAGAFTYATSNVIMSGTSKTLKMVGGQSLYNLGVTGATTLLSNIVVLHNFSMATTLSLGVYTLTNTGGWAYCTTDFTFATAGVFVAGIHLNVSGNIDISTITFTYGTSTVKMTGSSKTLKTANSNGALYNLQISGTTTTSSSINITHSLTIDSGKTFTIGAAKTIDLNCSNGGTYSNLGTITGATGTLMEYSFSTADKTLAFGVVNAPVRVRAISTTTANRTMTLSSDRVLGSTLLVNSDHASNTMTIDARTLYLGAIGAITEGTRGDILYATFSITSSPGYGGGVQTGHSYTYETNLSTTASPGQVYTFVSNATWLHWDSTDLAIYGTPDSVFGGHWYYVNISVADGMLSTYQNYTVLVVPIETLQDYIPLLMALLFGFGLLIAGLRFRELWILAGPVWIICGMTIFIPYGIVFLMVSIGLGVVLMFKGVSPYL